MKMRVRLSLQVIVSVIAFGVVLFAASHATASDDSLWVNSGTITRTLIAENITSDNSSYFDSFCSKFPQKENKYIQVGSTWLSNGYSDVNGGCWTSTSYGLFGTTPNGNYLRLSQVGAVTAMDDANGSYVPLPNSDKLVRRDGIGSSFYWGLSIYDHMNETFELRTNIGPKNRYAYPAEANRWKLKDPNTNQDLQVNKVNTSPNGKWLVVEGSGAFFRLNVETKEIVSFQAPINLYGYGTNPSYTLAISNDGRYATISTGGNNSGIFYLYDLATCVSNPNQIMQPATGCGKRDIRSVAMPGAASSAAPINVEFNNSEEGISYNHYENGNVNRYMITAPGRNEHLLEYLALGDSFSSGEGDSDGGRYYVAGTDGNGETVSNTGFTNFPYWKEKCHLSTRSYPYLLAHEAEITNDQFRSVACSGANLNDLLNLKSTGPIEERFNGHFDQMKDLASSQLSEVKFSALNNFTPGRTAQIEFVQKYKPRAVTIGIGGNDINFGEKLSECLLPGTCHYAGVNKKYTAIEIFLLYDKLVKAYAQLKSASPTTRFYAVGYPQLFTNGGQCGGNVHFDEAEQEYATYVVNYLNHTVAAAAAKAGVDYLRIEDSLAGNNLCSSADYPAVNGLQSGDDKSITGHDSQRFGVWGAESYHPNNIGHSLIANALQVDMGYSPVNTFNTCFPGIGLSCNTISSNRPTPPTYFGLEASFSPVVGDGIKVTNDSPEAPDNSVPKGADILVNSSGEAMLKPGSTANLTLHSDPVDLGQATVDAQGKVSANLEIPLDTPAGYHTLHVTGTTPGGDAVDYYQSIFVYATLEDFDGDGIPNENDTCGIIESSNIDADNDGIDDACDGFIGEVEAHPLYRVRNGDVTKGEIESRFYIERDVLEAKSKLNIVNDADPDGDGWSLVGHTESNYDGATQTQFWIDSPNVPHLLLNGGNSITCAQLTPVSLSVVVDSEDRLLQAEQENSCPDPEQFTVPASATVEVQGNGGMGSAGLGSGTFLVQPATGLFQQSEKPTIQQALSSVVPKQPIQIPGAGRVAGASTKTPNYFDGPGKNTANVADQVGNTFLIWGSVMAAVLLGVILLIRSLAIFAA